MVKCSWCMGSKGIINNGYHGGCLDAKLRVYADREKKAARSVRVAPMRRSVTPSVNRPSAAYRTLLVDFKERMARRGIKINV